MERISATGNPNKVPFKRLSAEIGAFKKNAPLTLLALPAIVMIFVFNYLPLYGLVLPFQKYSPATGVFGSPWVGLNNFKFLFKTGTIWPAIFNTIAYNLVFLFVGMVVAVAIALLLFELSGRAQKVYQTSLLIPYFLSWVAVSYIMNTLLDADRGVMNQLVKLFGNEAILWYNEPKYWPVILTVTNIWKNMGYNAVVYLAALTGLDSEYFEAAKIDGASKIKQIWHISLPMIRPIVIVMMILGVGNMLRGDFGLFYNVTMNSPLLYPTTDVIDTYVYRSLMNVSDIGMASTTGFIQSVVGFFLVMGTNLAVKKIEPDSALF